MSASKAAACVYLGELAIIESIAAGQMIYHTLYVLLHILSNLKTGKCSYFTALFQIKCTAKERAWLNSRENEWVYAMQMMFRSLDNGYRQSSSFRQMSLNCRIVALNSFNMFGERFNECLA